MVRMIQYIKDLVREGLKDVQRHPQVQLALLLVLILPVAFLFAANAFLQAGINNQDHLQKQSIHTVHQSLHVLMESDLQSLRTTQATVERLAKENQELQRVRILLQQGDLYIVLASDEASEVDTVVSEPERYHVLAQPGQTLHELRSRNATSYWWSRSLGTNQSGVRFVSETWYDRSVSEHIFLASALQAYIALITVFILVVLVAYWHIRTNSYYDLYEDAQHTIKNRHRFLQMVTHEIRAPLTAIRGYASMLLEEQSLNEKQSKQIAQIQRSSERVLSIASELLNISYIQSGKVAVHVETVDLAELVTETLQELRPLTKDKPVSLSQSGVLHKAEVRSDAKRLQQILVNLVSNAIKYSERGRIEIEIRHLLSGYELRVKDTGLEISVATQRKLYAPFYKIQEQDKYDALGVGLGMWITRQYIDAIGATVDVELIEHAGTHIVITVPKAYPLKAENTDEV